MGKEELIQTIVGRIKKDYQPEKILLFGSYALGREKPESDIDIMVIKDTKESFFRRLKRVALLCKDIDEAIDFLVYTPHEYDLMVSRYNPFFESIRNQSRVLYEKRP